MVEEDDICIMFKYGNKRINEIRSSWTRYIPNVNVKGKPREECERFKENVKKREIA